MGKLVPFRPRSRPREELPGSSILVLRLIDSYERDVRAREQAFRARLLREQEEQEEEKRGGD